MCVGFITMTPQLFINYKLKSVAHLPWRMLTYKALNTFIDDLFAFVIKMPMLYRIGCFRDGWLLWYLLLCELFKKHVFFHNVYASPILFVISFMYNIAVTSNVIINLGSFCIWSTCIYLIFQVLMYSYFLFHVVWISSIFNTIRRLITVLSIVSAVVVYISLK